MTTVGKIAVDDPKAVGPAQRPLRFATECSGIEAISVALPAGAWTPMWFAERAAAPAAILRARYPGVTIHGDVTAPGFLPAVAGGERPDLLAGGTPCPSFSTAGKRRGLDDERGRLALLFADHVDALNPRTALWENVPGVLTDATNAFGQMLARLAGCSAGSALEPVADGRVVVVPHTQPTEWGASPAGSFRGPRRTVAWRVLDARDVGVPQPRPRVLVLAAAHDTGITGIAEAFPVIAPTGNPPWADDEEGMLRRFATEEAALIRERTGTVLRRLLVRIPVTPAGHTRMAYGVGVARAGGGGLRGGSETLILSVDLDRWDDGTTAITRVGPPRRLTIAESERLLCFPVGFTDVPGVRLGARYTCIGNSISVHVLRPIMARLTALLRGEPMPRPAPITAQPLCAFLDDEAAISPSAYPSYTAVRGLLVRAILDSHALPALLSRSMAVAGAIAAFGPGADDDVERVTEATLTMAAAAAAEAGIAVDVLARRSGITPAAPGLGVVGGLAKPYDLRSKRKSLLPSGGNAVLDRFVDHAVTDEGALSLVHNSIARPPAKPLPLHRAEAVLAARDLIAVLLTERRSRADNSDRDFARRAASHGASITAGMFARVVAYDRQGKLITLLAVLHHVGATIALRRVASGDDPAPLPAIITAIRERVRRSIGSPADARTAANAAGVDTDVVTAWAALPTKTSPKPGAPVRRIVSDDDCADRIRPFYATATALGFQLAVVDRQAANTKAAATTAEHAA